jgi:hypothetical protein
MKNRPSTAFAMIIITLSLLVGVLLYQFLLKPYFFLSKVTFEQSLEIPTEITANDVEEVKKNCTLGSFLERKVQCTGVHKHIGTLYVIVYYGKNDKGVDVFVMAADSRPFRLSEDDLKRHFKRITFSKVAR